MSKTVKGLLRSELQRRLKGVYSMAVISLVGIGGVANNKLRRDLLGKDIHVTVVKNSIARQALSEMGMAPAGELLEGPCALAYGQDSVVGVVRELLARSKDVPAMSIRGAVMEGEIFPAARVKELSKYPTKPEAIAQAVGVVMAAGGNLVGAAMGPGAMIASLLKTIEERAEKAASAAAAEAPAPAAPEAPAAQAPASDAPAAP
jgi:large subunit ribosomal protein L10